MHIFLTDLQTLAVFDRWISLLTVMAGVSLVGLSGSLIKDTLKEDALGIFQTLIRSADLPTSEPTEQPEATKVLVGVFFILFAQILCVGFVSFSDILVLLLSFCPNRTVIFPRNAVRLHSLLWKRRSWSVTQLHLSSPLDLKAFSAPFQS